MDFEGTASYAVLDRLLRRVDKDKAYDSIPESFAGASHDHKNCILAF